MTSSDLSYAVELSDGLEITDTDLSFSENSQILDNSEVLDPEKDNEFVNDNDKLPTSCCTERNDMDKEESFQSRLITVFLFCEVGIV